MTKQIRVALSGSGYRLGAHLGALQAIQDAGFEVKELAATSGGSIVAALLASGMTLADLRQMCLTLDWSKYMSFTWAPLTLLTSQALCSGDSLLAFLTQLTKGATFKDSAIDVKIIASDLLTEQEFCFSKATTPDCPLAVAARASASIPIVFAPVAYGDGLYVDGGCTDNIPASELVVDTLPRVGIYLESDDAVLKPGTYSLSTLAPRIIDLLLASNELAHVGLDTKNGANIIHVPTGFASSFDRNMAVATRQKLYDVGYDTTKAAL
jgi:NTE family protein